MYWNKITKCYQKSLGFFGASVAMADYKCVKWRDRETWFTITKGVVLGEGFICFNVCFR
jgi:hypothetical protein